MSPQTSMHRRRRHRGEPNNAALAIALIGLGVLVGIIFFLGSRMRPSAVLPPDSILGRGELLYIQNCAPCHGPDGSGNPIVGAPPLTAAGQAWRLSDGQIQRNVQAGTGHIMPAFQDTLSNDDIEAIIRYVQTWWTEDQFQAQQELSAMDPIRK